MTFASSISRLVTGAGFAALVCAACGPDLPVPVTAVSVELTAHRADWEGAYLLPARSNSEATVRTGREVHVPLGADVTLIFSSREYISNFFAPDLGVREFAAPGLPGYFHFHADTPRRYELRADELCGLPHRERFVGTIVVESPERFQAWVHDRIKQEL